MVSHLTARVTSATFLVLRKHVFTQHTEVGLVSGETEHDEISIETIDDMLCIGVVRRVRALTTNIVHDFVFSLSRYRSIGNDHLELDRVSGPRSITRRSQRL